MASTAFDLTVIPLSQWPRSPGHRIGRADRCRRAVVLFVLRMSRSIVRREPYGTRALAPERATRESALLDAHGRRHRAG